MSEYIRTHVLEEANEETDLGVIVSNNLKPASQCAKAAAKAMSVLGMIRRHFKKLDAEDFLLLYKTYVRPHMEYCVQAWSPHLSKDVQCLEKVQRRATKLVSGLREKTYEERLAILGLTTLENRRLRGDLIETYKIITAKERIDHRQFFQLAANPQLRGHSLKLYKHRSRLDTRKYFFSQRVISSWNSLPQSVVDATSVNTFKNRLDNYHRCGQ